MTKTLNLRLARTTGLCQRLNRLTRLNAAQQGFTLVELLIVVVILGILSGIGIPAILNQQKKAVASANNTLAMSAARACAAAIAGGTPGDYKAPSNVNGTCDGTAQDFTADTDNTKATAGVASITAEGAVELKTKSAPK